MGLITGAVILVPFCALHFINPGAPVGSVLAGLVLYLATRKAGERNMIIVSNDSVEVLGAGGRRQVPLDKVRMGKVWPGYMYMLWPEGEVQLSAYERPNELWNEIARAKSQAL